VATFKCNTCGGTFTSPQRGIVYFHSCPPLAVGELIAAVDGGTIQVSAGVAADVALAKGPLALPGLPPTTADLARGRLALVAVTRPNFVDQNPIDTKPVAPGDPPKAPVSAGAGVTVQPEGV
jgi:hypothetical protein